MPILLRSSLAGAISITALACAQPGSGVIDDSLDGGSGAAMCGNGLIEAPEQCDDENDNPRDDCTNECVEPTCGDGVKQDDEACDDGDDDDGNTCTSSCELGPTAVAAVSMGSYHACAVSGAGTVRCWGSADYGILGQPGYDETIGDDEPPNDWDPIDVGDGVVDIAAGPSHNCVRREGGTMACWGANDYGQLGLGSYDDIGDDETPASVGDLPLSDIVDIAVGAEHTCAVTGNGEVRCWGYNNSGQLGTGDTMAIGDDETIDALVAIELPGAAVEVVAGSEHTCARLDDGAVACWGRAAEGQLGYGDPNAIGDDELPNSAGTVPVGGAVIDIDARHNHTCAVLEGGTVRCWGAALSGQLGYGDTKNVGERKTPAEIGDVMLDETAIAIETGTAFTCAVIDTGDVRCWGNMTAGGLPDVGGDLLTPQAAAHVGAPVRALSSGEASNCAILDSAAVRCWGSNSGNVLGYPEIDSYTPVKDATEVGDVQAF